MEFKRILIIQTAFIGDVILATPVLSQLKKYYPDAAIDFLVRKGNESLFSRDSRIDELMTWDKKKGKYQQLWQLLRHVRSKRYDLLVNLQRFASMGFLSCFSQAKLKVGFDKNPFSFSYDLQVIHSIENGKHEVQRNLDLIAPFVEEESVRPSLMISDEIKQQVSKFQRSHYMTIAPTSVWFTKQFPAAQWVKFINASTFEGTIYLLGAPVDADVCDQIIDLIEGKKVINLCGKLSLLESAALMAGAVMNYVNDSAPMHLASSMNAPVTAVYCSTVTEFGFGPLSEQANIVEHQGDLACRPCGLHGHKKCPESHFNCAQGIRTAQLLATIPHSESGVAAD